MEYANDLHVYRCGWVQMPVPGDVDICARESESWQCQGLGLASLPSSLDSNKLLLELTEGLLKGLRQLKAFYSLKPALLLPSLIISDINKSWTWIVKHQRVTHPALFVLQTWMKPQIMLLIEKRCAINFLSDHIHNLCLEEENQEKIHIEGESWAVSRDQTEDKLYHFTQFCFSGQFTLLEKMIRYFT